MTQIELAPFTCAIFPFVFVWSEQPGSLAESVSGSSLAAGGVVNVFISSLPRASFNWT